MISQLDQELPIFCSLRAPGSWQPTKVHTQLRWTRTAERSLTRERACEDHLWWGDGNFAGGHHPNWNAPRCGPCRYGVPLPEHMPWGCPCSPAALCTAKHPGLNHHGSACGIPRWGLPGLCRCASQVGRAALTQRCTSTGSTAAQRCCASGASLCMQRRMPGQLDAAHSCHTSTLARSCLTAHGPAA